MALDGIVYVNTHAGDPRGTGKGSPLTVDEADDNFYTLYTRIKALQDDPPTAVSISNIQVNGSQMLVSMTDASTFGPFTLPIAKLAFRGDYVAGTQYFSLDLINVPQQGLYMVLEDVIDDDDPFDPTKSDGSGNAYFNQVFGSDTLIYDIGFFFPGRPGIGIEAASEMMAHCFVREVTFPIALAGSLARLKIAPAADLSFPLQKNGTVIGSVDFALGSATGTFTFTTAVDFAIADLLEVMVPTAVDTAARSLSLTLLGIRI